MPGLNDNMWHSVLLEITSQIFILEVDEMPMQQPLSESNFDFTGENEIQVLFKLVIIVIICLLIVLKPCFCFS